MCDFDTCMFLVGLSKILMFCPEGQVEPNYVFEMGRVEMFEKEQCSKMFQVQVRHYTL